jgi:hypothetical protein
MAQVVEHLPNILKTPGSIPITAKTNKQKKLKGQHNSQFGEIEH